MKVSRIYKQLINKISKTNDVILSSIFGLSLFPQSQTLRELTRHGFGFGFGFDLGIHK